MDFWNPKNIKRALLILEGSATKEVAVAEGVSAGRISHVALTICLMAGARLADREQRRRLDMFYSTMREAMKDKDKIIPLLKEHLSDDANATNGK